MKIYTRKGDDGTTGLLYGGRVSKDSVLPSAYGTVDEAQAVMGIARAYAERGSELDQLLVGLERDLYVLMAELATDPANRHKLTPGQSLVTAEMVTALEVQIDELGTRFEPPTEFVVPGESLVAAQLDLARTVVRRAERDTIRALTELAELPDLPDPPGLEGGGTHCAAYLNRLSDLLWTMARWQEGTSRPSRSAEPG
jgi:cob(I)alamin adenosyltransferase